MHQYILLTLILVIFISIASAASDLDSVSFATYYPAPYGVYGQMRAKNMAVGDNYINGESYSWENGTISANADLVVEGDVGVGTSRPNHKLDVAGNIGLSSGSYINFGSTSGAAGYGLYDNSGALQYKDNGGDWSNIGGSSNQKFALLQNRQTSNVNGGLATTGSWQAMPINTEQEDPDGIVDSSSLPTFSLNAGIYRIEAVSPFGYNVGNCQTRIYNITDGVITIVGNTGMNFHHPAENSASTLSIFLIGTITINNAKQFRLEYRVDRTTGNTYDLGMAANYGDEVFAQVMITKLK